MYQLLDSLKSKWMFYRLKKQAEHTFPEDLPASCLWPQSRGLKVAVIDDQGFQFKNHLESRGVSVSVFQDYFKPQSQRQEKRKAHPFAQYDIILCDINGIADGADGFGDLGGVGAIDTLRHNFPFKMIIAYTGNPGALSRHMKNKNNNNIVDKVYDKQWSRDDFIETFEQSSKVFTHPGARWLFIRNRLTYLGAREKEIDRIRESFVLSCLIKSNPEFVLKSDAELEILARKTIAGISTGSMSSPLRLGLAGLGLVADLFGIVSEVSA